MLSAAGFTFTNLIAGFIFSGIGLVAFVYGKKEGRMNGLPDLYDAVMEGAVQRLRPKLMTVGANIFGLMPVMFSSGTGADVMKRIAAPLIGGLISSTILTLIVLPAIYTIWKYHSEIKPIPKKT